MWKRILTRPRRRDAVPHVTANRRGTPCGCPGRRGTPRGCARVPVGPLARGVVRWSARRRLPPRVGQAQAPPLRFGRAQAPRTFRAGTRPAPTGCMRSRPPSPDRRTATTERGHPVIDPYTRPHAECRIPDPGFRTNRGHDRAWPSGTGPVPGRAPRSAPAHATSLGEPVATTPPQAGRRASRPVRAQPAAELARLSARPTRLFVAARNRTAIEWPTCVGRWKREVHKRKEGQPCDFHGGSSSATPA